MKRVSYEEYDKALSQARQKISETVGDGVQIYDMGGSFKRPVSLGVNWAAIGTVSPDRAEAFAEAIGKAAQIAKTFPYNGYQIEY